MGFLPGIGTSEMLIVGVIALLLFGKNLPHVAKNLGKSFAEFKKGVSGFQDEIRNVTREVDHEIRNATREVDRALTYNPPADSDPANSSEQGKRPRSTPVEENSDDDFSAPRFDIS